MLYNIGLVSITSLLNLLPTSHLIPSHPSTFEFPESYSKFPLATYFIYGSVYVSMLLSPFLLLLLIFEGECSFLEHLPFMYSYFQQIIPRAPIMCQVCGEDTAVNKEVKSLLFWSLHCYWIKQVTSREIMCTHINTYLYVYIYIYIHTHIHS